MYKLWTVRRLMALYIDAVAGAAGVFYQRQCTGCNVRKGACSSAVPDASRPTIDKHMHHKEVFVCASP